MAHTHQYRTAERGIGRCSCGAFMPPPRSEGTGTADRPARKPRKLKAVK